MLFGRGGRQYGFSILGEVLAPVRRIEAFRKDYKRGTGFGSLKDLGPGAP